MAKKINQEILDKYLDDLFKEGKTDEIAYLKFVVYKVMTGKYELNDFISDLMNTELEIKKLIDIYYEVRNEKFDFEFIGIIGDYSKIANLIQYLFQLVQKNISLKDISYRISRINKKKYKKINRGTVIEQVIKYGTTNLSDDELVGVNIRQMEEEKPVKSEVTMRVPEKSLDDEGVQEEQSVFIFGVVLNLKDEEPTLSKEEIRNGMKELRFQNAFFNNDRSIIYIKMPLGDFPLRNDDDNVKNLTQYFTNSKRIQKLFDKDIVAYLFYLIISQDKQNDFLRYMQDEFRKSEFVKLEQKDKDLKEKERELEEEKVRLDKQKEEQNDLLKTEQQRVFEKDQAVNAKAQEIGEAIQQLSKREQQIQAVESQLVEQENLLKQKAAELQAVESKKAITYSTGTVGIRKKGTKSKTIQEAIKSRKSTESSLTKSTRRVKNAERKEEDEDEKPDLEQSQLTVQLPERQRETVQVEQQPPADQPSGKTNGLNEDLENVENEADTSHVIDIPGIGEIKITRITKFMPLDSQKKERVRLTIEQLIKIIDKKYIEQIIITFQNTYKTEVNNMYQLFIDALIRNEKLDKFIELADKAFPFRNLESGLPGNEPLIRTKTLQTQDNVKPISVDGKREKIEEKEKKSRFELRALKYVESESFRAAPIPYASLYDSEDRNSLLRQEKRKTLLKQRRISEIGELNEEDKESKENLKNSQNPDGGDME